MPDDKEPKDPKQQGNEPDPKDSDPKTNDPDPQKQDPQNQEPRSTEERIKDLEGKGYTSDVLAKMVVEAREENAKHRKTNQELKTKMTEFTKIAEDYESNRKTLQELQKRLDSYTKKEKEEDLAKKDEIGKLQTYLEDANKEVQEHVKSIESLKQELVSTQDELKKQAIVNHVLFETQAKGYKWRNEFEKDGLIARTTVKKADGSFLSLEEVGEMVKEFIDANYQPPPAAPAGPANRTTSRTRRQELEEELITLHKRPPKSWSAADGQRHQELLKELDELTQAG